MSVESVASVGFRFPSESYVELVKTMQAFGTFVDFKAKVSHPIPPQGMSTIDVDIEFTTCDGSAKQIAEMFKTIVSQKFPQCVSL